LGVRSALVLLIAAITVVGGAVPASAAQNACNPPFGVTATPDAGSFDVRLTAVDARTASDVWAVGEGQKQLFFEHWEGSGWPGENGNPKGSDAHVPGTEILSATDGWATGYQRGDRQPMAIRYNGSRWTDYTMPQPGDVSETDDVVSVSTNEAWAVGSYF